MPQFRYRGVTQTGALVVGDVKASSREQVPQRIECLGHWPIEVVPQFAPVASLDPAWRPPFPTSRKRRHCFERNRMHPAPRRRRI